MHAELKSALQSLSDGDGKAALVILLEVWRRTNAPAIADTLTALSDKLVQQEPPIATVGSKSARQLWMEVAKADRPEMFPRLLEVLPEGNDRGLRLEAILEMDRDPRITPFAITWCHSRPISGPRRAPFFVRLVKLLAKTKDVRLLEPVAKLLEKDARPATVSRIGISSIKPLRALHEELTKILPKPLSAEEQSTLDAIKKLSTAAVAKTTTSHADLKTFFEKVYRDPEDDEARAVLGDLLQQQNDPRGEFIALQLARGPTGKITPRERKLEDMWGRKWLGRLDPVIAKKDVVFERGFLSRCRFEGGSEGAKTAGHEEWSTVTHLDCAPATGFQGGSHELLRRTDVMRSLRHVIGLGSEDLTRLRSADTEFPWETIGFELWNANDLISFIATSGAKTFPKARTLTIAPRRASGSLDVELDKLDIMIRKWSTLKELDLAIPPVKLGELATKPSIRKLEKLVLRRSDQVSFAYVFQTKELTISFEDVRSANMIIAVETINTLANQLSVVKVEAEGRVTIENDELKRGRATMMLGSLRKMVAASGATLEFAL